MTGRVSRMATTAGLLAVVVATFLAACGPSSGAVGADASPVATSTVDLPPSYRFVPAAITVAAGTTVTWTNHDNFTHNVAFKDGGLPADEHVLKPGASYAITFVTAGTYHFQCTFHPQQMQGTVVVTP
jgi:plastocyanin